MLSTAAANREPGVWAEPDTLDLTQYVNEVLSKNRSLAAMIAA